MLLLGLDLETTNLDPAKAQVIEVGVVLWDTSLQQPVRLEDFLITYEPVLEIPKEVTELTSITSESCQDFGRKEKPALLHLLSWINACEAVVTHNGNRFDRPILVNWTQRLNTPPIPDKLWIDTLTDLPLPDNTSRKLSYMAADHQFINPFPHRAVFDVMTMLRILSNYPIEDVIKMAQTPVVTIYAYDLPYADRDLAKERKYHWDPDKKIWWKEIKTCFLEKEQAEAGFQVRILGTS